MGRTYGGAVGANVLRDIDGGMIVSNYFVNLGDDSIDATGRSGVADFPGTTWGGPAGANVFVGTALPHPAFETRYPENKFFRGRVDGVRDEYPTARKVAVIPNEYDPGRAHVVVFNWPAAQSGEPATSADVDLSSFLSNAAAYEVRSAENPLGPPVAAGHCPPCGSIAIPMSAGTVAAPIGGAKTPPSMLPYFGAFLVTTTPGVK
jgi:hypothetical protein